MKNTIKFTLMILFIYTLGAAAHGDEKHEPESNPLFSGLSTDAAKVVQKFHQALNAKDTATVQAVLSDAVLIYESGHAERSAAEYASGHMMADMKYLESVTSELLEHQVTVKGDTAISTSRAKNTRDVAGEKSVNTASETIILMNIKGRWLITHIHWS